MSSGGAAAPPTPTFPPYRYTLRVAQRYYRIRPHSRRRPRACSDRGGAYRQNTPHFDYILGAGYTWHAGPKLIVLAGLFFFSPQMRRKISICVTARRLIDRVLFRASQMFT
ncbi:hypothetical protein BS50DRAFT_355515 [Corynespora cassiicola Philippines]|uniref:Uncharacterized protein n=1 Tax=Corynespora cassiicola Philippines TaxID=1448308 RepID=A0A2T2NRG9_CORCC|nr:hypothetical protein BS50DRAFT_355515 [Corynespora cassiicola Philippines]